MENLTPEQIKDLATFYKTFDLKQVKNIKNLQDQILYQLYKTNKKSDLQPTFDIYKRNFTHQADILYLPSDSGYKYGLTVVDIGSRLTDCMPLKSKSSLAVKNAIEKIYNRPVAERILEKPQRLEVDDGSEFKSSFKKYCDDNKIFIRYAEPYRSRQQALAESRNGAISKPLLRRMLAEELLTKKTDTKWIKYLPQVIKFLNERYKLTDAEITKLQNKKDSFLKLDKFNSDLLQVGQKVRYLLDKPQDYITNKKLIGGFRQGDVKYSKAVKIEELKLIPNQLPLYKVENRDNWFTKDQLQPINKEILPPETVKIKAGNKK
jgi:hypothetical protein